jgi:hypothetical protein
MVGTGSFSLSKIKQVFNTFVRQIFVGKEKKHEESSVARVVRVSQKSDG